MSLEFSSLIKQLGDNEDLLGLIRRLNLLPQLLRCQEEEAIIQLVDLSEEWLQERRNEYLERNPQSQLLESKACEGKSDLDLNLAREEALHRFALQQFGPGLEEVFLAANGGHDQIVYSLLRVSDPALAQELWIRLEEGETTFAEAATEFSEGPEAARRGIIGPSAIAQLQPPQFEQILRTLRPGQIHQPTQIGGWWVLLRLEHLSPARFDTDMHKFLLQKQMDEFLNERVQNRLKGEDPGPLSYLSDTSSES
ncbi:MAG TPA: peptidylprolyl isomerase [Prochlorococcus sp.]|jgi:parvulin-like peptidyl-prolyl isomerase